MVLGCLAFWLVVEGLEENFGNALGRGKGPDARRRYPSRKRYPGFALIPVDRLVEDVPHSLPVMQRTEIRGSPRA